MRIEKDFGTPELVKKRAMATGSGDPALSEHPLGILYVRGYLNPKDPKVSANMYYAGMRFGAVWGMVFKPPYAQSNLSPYVPGGAGGEWSEAELVAAAKKLREVRAVMRDRQVYDALVNCVIYRHMPPRTDDYRHIGKLRLALCRLVQMDLTLDVQK
jgi:hypothetical protein